MANGTSATGATPADPHGGDGPVQRSHEVDGLVQLSFVVLDIVGRIAAEHDLSLTQVRLLGILRDHTPTMAGLATHLGLDRSSVSGLIDRAARRDLVRRAAAAHDGRVIHVAITPHGQALAARVAAAIAPPLTALLDRLPAPERAALAALAAALAPDTLAP